MKKVSGSEVVTTAEASELPLPEGIEEALGELVGVAEGGAAGAVGRTRRAGRARLDGSRGDRGRGPEGQARPGPDGEASRSRGRVNDARGSARRGQPAADAHARRRA
jgi:hypothetical protein